MTFQSLASHVALRRWPLATVVWFSCILLIASPRIGRAALLHLNVVNELGQGIPARVQVLDGLGDYFPADTCSSLMSHNDSAWMRAYFYYQEPLLLSLCPGVTTITAGHGFECRPVRISFNLQNDTTVTVTIPRVYDLRSLGWFGGDTHTHMVHPPQDYLLTPADMHTIAQAEDLPMTWVTDNEYNFTGSPDVVSTPDAILYFSVEYHNKATGHACMLGLKEIFAIACCGVPAAAYPLLSDTREEWNPGWDEAMTLCHPISGADFFDDSVGWPAAGLAREVPVQAASGNLDIYDIASYSNVGDLALDDWYRLLNCGYHIPPGAGTDAIMDRYWVRPAGGYRVYVKETSTSHNSSDWVQGLKAGRCFVTNYPLIPEFTIDGQDAGSTLDYPGPTATVSVHLAVESTLPVSTAKIIVNGEVAQTFDVPGGPDGSSGVFDTQLTVNKSSWIAVRVDGVTDLRHAVSNSLFAHTGPIYVRLGGLEIERTIDAAYFQDWCDSLEIFVENRGNWPSEEAHAHVLQRIDDARVTFGSHFLYPPSAFELLAPANGAVALEGGLVHFDWSDATVREPGDRVRYRLAISADTSFAGGYLSPPLSSSRRIMPVPLPPNQAYWWRVVAEERGGHTTPSTPRRRLFYLATSISDVDSLQTGGDSPSLTTAALSVWPNPATDQVHLQWSQAAGSPGDFEIFDVGGRLVLRVHSVISSALTANAAGGPSLCPTGTWEGFDAGGRAVPGGLYWVRYVPAGSAAAYEAGGTALRARILLLR